MGPRRRKNKNVVKKCILRQVREGAPCSAQYPRSSFQTWLDVTSHCIPLRSIQTDNSFAKGHVLLGFTKCGEYLLSYYKELQGVSISVGLLNYKYSLYWWRFNMRRPLQQVCHISLFVGEDIIEDLLLVVCQTLNDNRIVVHGFTDPDSDEQCRQCYVTVCPSPPESSSISRDDTWIVHMKYNLLPPFPLFEVPMQLRIQDTVVLNTVDSVLAVTISPCSQHKTSNTNFKPERCEEYRTSSCEKSKTEFAHGVVADSEVEYMSGEKFSVKSPISASEVEKKFITGESELSRNEEKNYIHKTANANKLNKGGVVPDSVREEVEISCKDDQRKTGCITCNSCSDCDNLPSICLDPKTLNYDHLIISNLINNNQEVNVLENDCIEYNVADTSKSSYLTSFNFKTFSTETDSEMVESSSSSTVIDGTSYLDIQFTTVEDTPYKLIECLQDRTEMNDHKSPCIHTRVVSLDVERYINDALNTVEELKGKYWSLKNYSTLLVDVCEGSQCVILHIVILISVQDNNGKAAKREICSLSLLLTWSIASGIVQTVRISPPTYTTEKTEKEIFKEGRAKVEAVRKKYSVPYCAVQAYSNRNVFHGKTLEFIRHPFQPIAIVL